MGQQLISNFQKRNVTIGTDADGLSNEIPCLGVVILGLVMPSAWTAAAITFKGSWDGGTTYYNLYESDGDEISWTVDASRVILPLGTAPLMAALTHIQLRSGSAATPVQQAASRTLTLLVGVPNP